MRRVAMELGVATMSLYRHVRGKDELVLFMIDEAIGEEVFPEIAAVRWRARLEQAARLQWTLFRRHRWLGPAMSLTRPQLAPNALAYADWVMQTLAGLGLGPSAMLHTHVMLFSYVRGLATGLEAEADAERDTGMTSDEWMETQEAALHDLAGSGSFATFCGLPRSRTSTLTSTRSSSSVSGECLTAWRSFCRQPSLAPKIYLSSNRSCITG